MVVAGGKICIRYGITEKKGYKLFIRNYAREKTMKQIFM